MGKDKMSANKYDSQKATITMIPRSALEQEAQVLAFGANKYGRDNWREGMDYTRLLDATLRHIVQFNDGEDLDLESGISHLAHARCSLGFLIEYVEKGLGRDDRYKEDKSQCMDEVSNMRKAIRPSLQQKVEADKDKF